MKKPWLKSKSLNLNLKKKNPHLYKTQPAAGKNSVTKIKSKVECIFLENFVRQN